MTGRTALVTGAARGIGLATAAKLLDAGHRVAIVDADEEELDRAVRTLPPDRVLPIAIDITAVDAPRQIAAVLSAWDPVSILINNAGISPKHNGKSAKLAEITLDEWQAVFDINVTAAMRLSQRFVPEMGKRGWGRVVNVSSRAGRGAGPNSSPAYMSSKAAILGLTRSIASEFAAHGVTANSVAPGMVETDMASAVDPLIKERMKAAIPVGRTGRPPEVGALIAFLASDDAGFITGACIDANGGAFMC